MKYEVPINFLYFCPLLIAVFFLKKQIPSEVQKILDDPKCNVDSKSSDFWILAAALKDFVKNQGQGKYLPLTGSIPDMTASTDLYIALQKVYELCWSKIKVF